MSNELKVAIEATKKGAEYAIRFFGKNLTVGKKSDNTVFTQVDKDTESLIKNIIKNEYPDAKFVGEETGGIPNKGTFWTIDPIDGTRYFTRKTPLWATLISLITDGKPVIGVSNIPCLNELIFAEKGKGTFINNKKVTASTISTLKDSILMFGSLRFFKEKIFPTLRLVEACASARSWETTYSGCLVTEGKMDISVDAYGKVWDIAPFKLLIEEAGGRITRLNGDEWDLKGRGAVITNGILHEKVLEILNKK